MKKRCRIKLTYQNDSGIDPDIDEKVTGLMEKIGAEWYAQGFALATKTRDMAFELEVEGEKRN